MPPMVQTTQGGETRLITGSLPTDRRYTGQRQESVALGGLYDYGARFYAPYLNRWLNPDTIVPDPTNPQSLNRYTYVSNRPLNRIDPAGHRDLDCMAHPGTCGRYIANPYLRLSGDWSYAYQATIISSAQIIEYRLKSADAAAARREARGYRFEDGPVSYLDFCLICGLNTPGQAWQAVFGSVTIARVRRNAGFGAQNFGDRNTIEFYNEAFTVPERFRVHHPLHEFGHNFAWHANQQQPYRDLDSAQISAGGRDVAGGGFGGGYLRTGFGYQSGWPNSDSRPWQQNTDATPGEDFADMFLNWNLQSFADDRGAGAARYGWMNANMSRWIALAVRGD